MKICQREFYQGAIPERFMSQLFIFIGMSYGVVRVRECGAAGRVEVVAKGTSGENEEQGQRLTQRVFIYNKLYID